MRTSALRVTAGVYEHGGWHVTFIEDTYERGVLKNSELVVGPLYCGWSDVERVMQQQLRLLRARELARISVPAAG